MHACMYECPLEGRIFAQMQANLGVAREANTKVSASCAVSMQLGLLSVQGMKVMLAEMA